MSAFVAEEDPVSNPFGGEEEDPIAPLKSPSENPFDDFLDFSDIPTATTASVTDAAAPPINGTTSSSTTGAAAGAIAGASVGGEDEKNPFADGQENPFADAPTPISQQRTVGRASTDAMALIQPVTSTRRESSGSGGGAGRNLPSSGSMGSLFGDDDMNDDANPFASERDSTVLALPVVAPAPVSARNKSVGPFGAPISPVTSKAASPKPAPAPMPAAAVPKKGKAGLSSVFGSDEDTPAPAPAAVPAAGSAVGGFRGSPAELVPTDARLGDAAEAYLASIEAEEGAGLGDLDGNGAENPFYGSTSSWTAQWENAHKTIESKFENITILVCAPELITSMMSKHVVYTVKTDPLRYAVRRRYSEFAWLRESLVHRYEGLFIPSIPATTLFSPTTATLTTNKTDITGDFVKNRMSQLHLFMQNLCKISFLRTDPTFLAFISTQNEKEFKQMVDIQTPGKKAVMVGDDEENLGLCLWNDLISKTEVNCDAERLITDFKRQIDVLRSQLYNVEKECRATGARAVQAAQSMKGISEQITAWSDLEKSLLDPNRNEYVNLNGAKVKLYMSALEAGHEHWLQNVSLLPKVIARVVLSSIQFQQVQLDGFRAHLVSIEGIMRDLERAQKEKHRAVEEKAKAAVSSSTNTRASIKLFSKGPEELEEVLAKKAEQVEILQNKNSRAIKALVFCEIDRFNKERLESTAYLLGSLAATNLQISQISTAKWSQIASTAGMDMARFDGCLTALQTSLDDDAIFGGES